MTTKRTPTKDPREWRAMRLKVQAEAYPWLEQAAREVNTVWNWANETSERAIRRFAGPAKFLSDFELHHLAAGGTKYFSRIGANTINAVCTQFVRSRRAAKACRLNWRKSAGARRSLGWVPFRAAELRRRGKALRFYGKTIRVVERGLIDGMKFRDGCFAQDALGQWWLCLPVEVELTDVPATRDVVGIDLGLKATATTSDSDTLEAGAFYRGIEAKLAQALGGGAKGAAIPAATPESEESPRRCAAQVQSQNRQHVSEHPHWRREQLPTG